MLQWPPEHPGVAFGKLQPAQFSQYCGSLTLLKPLSTMPLQSSSRLLQVSVAGPTSPTHTSVPLAHDVVPVAHSPVSTPHVAPLPGFPSSTVPSQSLSTLSHI